MIEKKRLTPEELVAVATTLRKILTHDDLERLIASEAAWNARGDMQDELIASLNRSGAIKESLIDALKKQVAHQEEGIKLLETVVDCDSKALENRERTIQAFEQAEMASRAMHQSSEYYAIEARSMLTYVLERSDRSRDWLRLWEALPQDQKNVYLQESKEWLGKQPTHVDPEIAKRMLPAPGIEYRKGGDSA